MTVFNAEEVMKCLEDVVGEDKLNALWLLEWAINKRSFDLEQHDKQIVKETLSKVWKKAISMHDNYVELEELDNYIDEIMSEI